MSDEATVACIPDDVLIRRAIYSIRVTKSRPLWVGVMDTFLLGSTFSRQLCRRFGFNPDATKRSDLRSPHD